MKANKPLIYAITAAIVASPITTLAMEDDETPFEEGRLFFELNDTDGDLGIHGKIDGDEWKRLKIEDPRERKMLDVKVRGRLKRQGLTELFFESAEPTFDELDPADFFARFPAGIYEIEGITLDGEERENEVYLSHVIPAAPMVVEVGEATEAPGDDECWVPSVAGDIVIDWDDVTHAHATLGTNNGQPLGDNEVLYYEIVFEVDGTDYKSTAQLPPEITAWTVPEDFIDLADGVMVEDDERELGPVEEIKFEVLVRVITGEHEDDDGEIIESVPGNKSALEGCFEI